MVRFKELDNHVQLMTQIKRGEEKIKKREEIQKYLDLKMEKYIKPFQHLRIQCVLAQLSNIRSYFKSNSAKKNPFSLRVESSLCCSKSRFPSHLGIFGIVR
jgi:hypothetical protein